MFSLSVILLGGLFFGLVVLGFFGFFFVGREIKLVTLQGCVISQYYYTLLLVMVESLMLL